MNEYGQAALEYWTSWLPSRVARMSAQEQTRFFHDLGEQVQAQILIVEEALEAQYSDQLKDLDYLDRLGRLNAIRAQAREQVMAQMVYDEPERTDEDEDLEDPDDPLAEWMDPLGMPRDRTHPLWAMQEDESVTTQEFAQAARQWEDGLRQMLQARRDSDSRSAPVRPQA